MDTIKTSGSVNKAKRKSENNSRQVKVEIQLSKISESRGKFTAIQAFLETQEKSHINSLIYHLTELEKEPTKPKIKEEVRKYLETNENINNFPKPVGCSKSSSKI